MTSAVVAVPGLVAIERLAPPVALSGAEGTNRGFRAQIAASNDLEAISAWLSRYTGHTWRDHRKELERLVLWSVVECGKALSSLTVEDCIAYRNFLRNIPETTWIGPRASRFSSAWRPFSGQLSAASRQHAESVVGAAFRWLRDVGYLHGNPWSASAGAQRAATEVRVTRTFEQETWRRLMADLATEPVRIRFLVMALYRTRFRISELAQARMSDVVRIVRPGGDQWWLSTVGKGNKKREVPIPRLIDLLMEYRTSIGLAGDPREPGVPLVGRQHNATIGMTANGIHRVLKDYLSRASARLSLPDIAGMSAHWFRHASTSHGIDRGESLGSARESLGHASLQTTSIYVHTARDAQYDAFCQEDDA